MAEELASLVARSPTRSPVRSPDRSQVAFAELTQEASLDRDRAGRTVHLTQERQDRGKHSLTQEQMEEAAFQVRRGAPAAAPAGSPAPQRSGP